MPLNDILFNAGFAALLLAESTSLCVRFGWLAWVSLADALSLFKKRSSFPVNSETRTFVSFGNLWFARWNRREQIPSLLLSFPAMDTEQIIEHLKAERERLDKAIAVLNGTGTARLSHRGGPRHMSAAARARISAAQKRRWAKVKAMKKK